MEQTVFKIRHKPTGLFYQPIKGRWAKEKSHLSRTGKLYETKNPPRIPTNHIIYVSNTQVKNLSLVVQTKNEWSENHLSTNESEWEIVKYKLIEL